MASGILTQCLLICLLLKLGDNDSAYADICTEFREGNVDITGASITTSHLYFVLGTILYRFPSSSFDADKLQLSLNDHPTKKVDLKEAFPNKYDTVKIKAMFVWQNVDEELLCFHDETETIECFNEAKDDLERKRLNSFLHADEWLVLNATGYGHKIVTKNTETFLQKGNQKSTSKTLPPMFIPDKPMFRVYRVAQNPQYLELLSTKKKVFNDADYKKARSEASHLTKQDDIDKLDFAWNEPQRTHWKICGFYVNDKVVNLANGFITYYPLDHVLQDDLYIIKQERKSLEKFFICQETFIGKTKKGSKIIFILVLVALMIVLVACRIIIYATGCNCLGNGNRRKNALASLSATSPKGTSSKAATSR